MEGMRRKAGETSAISLHPCNVSEIIGAMNKKIHTPIWLMVVNVILILVTTIGGTVAYSIWTELGNIKGDGLWAVIFLGIPGLVVLIFLAGLASVLLIGLNVVNYFLEKSIQRKRESLESRDGV
jgi:hypothetical protein